MQDYEESGVGVESVPLGEGLDLFTLRNRKLRALGSPLVYKGELKVRLVHARGLRMKDSVLKGAGQLFGNDTKPNTYGVLQVRLIVLYVQWLLFHGIDIHMEQVVQMTRAFQVKYACFAESEFHYARKSHQKGSEHVLSLSKTRMPQR